MTGKQLKNAILQLAIQGKLVPQDANDEPASVLLAKIRKEKEQLVKAGKLKKKELETTPITDEEKPFEIPESWEWCRWGDLSFSIQYGYNASAQVSGDIRMVRISDIQNNDVVWDSVPFCKIKKDEIDNYLLEENDILFARTGGTVGKSFLVSKVPYSAIYAGYLIRTRYSKNLVPKYLKSFMESSIYWEQLRDGTIATAQPNCNGKTLTKMLIPLPPLSEQKRIVAKIEELMPLVEEYGVAQEKLNRLNAALPEALKKSILQQAIQGKLVPQDANDEPASVLLTKIRKEKEQLVKAGKLKKKELETTPITDEEIPFEIPESWEWVRVEDISNSFIGLTYKPTDVSENGTVVLRSSNIQNGKIDLTDKVKVNLSIPEKLIVHENDILICARNGSSKLVGKSALITKEANGMTFGAFMAICKTIFYDFVYLFLQSNLFFSQLREVSGTTTINQLTQKNFNGFILPLPPLSEQRRIVARVEELLSMVEGMK